MKRGSTTTTSSKRSPRANRQASSQASDGSHYEDAVGFDGKTFRYIVCDAISPPRMVETTCVTRIVGHHPPIGGDCPGCFLANDTAVLVEHTTWGESWTTSICSTCASKAERFLSGQTPQEPDFTAMSDEYADMF